jgi:hypothetical protein
MLIHSDLLQYTLHAFKYLHMSRNFAKTLYKGSRIYIQRILSWMVTNFTWKTLSTYGCRQRILIIILDICPCFV